jgi:hypothetical protein
VVTHLPLCTASIVSGSDGVISSAEAVRTATPPPDAMTAVATDKNNQRRESASFFTESFSRVGEGGDRQT